MYQIRLVSAPYTLQWEFGCYFDVFIYSSSMFGQAAAAAVQATKDEGADADDDNEEPPKEEIKQVVEDDAIHSVRYN